MSKGKPLIFLQQSTFHLDLGWCLSPLFLAHCHPLCSHTWIYIVQAKYKSHSSLLFQKALQIVVDNFSVLVPHRKSQSSSVLNKKSRMFIFKTWVQELHLHITNSWVLWGLPAVYTGLAKAVNQSSVTRHFRNQTRDITANTMTESIQLWTQRININWK